MTQLAPGMKVARRIQTRPDQVALGKVLEGGQVLWQEIVNDQGVESNRTVPGVRPGKPVPLKGDELPCPPEWAHLVK